MCSVALLHKFYSAARFANDCIPVVYTFWYSMFAASNLDWVKLQLTSQLFRDFTASLAGSWDANRRNCDAHSTSFLFTWAHWPEAGSSSWLPHLPLCLCLVGLIGEDHRGAGVNTQAQHNISVLCFHKTTQRVANTPSHQVFGGETDSFQSSC